jgi:alkanesulfonate monooxygenase SsuD/methylene tetrahydromethanopterin reductase-like flavin-dependent oxidoreductase (luciferase family)
MVTLAAKFAKEWNCFYKSVDEVVQMQAVMNEICVSIQRDPGTLQRSLMTPLILGRDVDEVNRCIARHREVFSGLPRDLEEWRASGFLGGTVAETRGQLEQLQEAGVNRIIFEFNDVNDVATLELAAGELGVV